MALEFPLPGPTRRFAFAELARRHGDYAIVGIALAADVHEGRLSDLRIAFFGMGNTPMRALGAETRLAGTQADESTLEAAVLSLDEDMQPDADLHSSAAAKRHLAGVLLRRARSSACCNRRPPSDGHHRHPRPQARGAHRGQRRGARLPRGAAPAPVDWLRDELGLKGTRVGCEHGVCGACTVLIDGEIARGCPVLAVQADGRRIETIEGLSDAGTLADLQRSFSARNAAQCGACTSGMLLTAHALLERTPCPGRDTIREQISGNYCRCTATTRSSTRSRWPSRNGEARCGGCTGAAGSAA